MATRIRFKRGDTDVIQSYLDAYVGEPLYDTQTGALYAKKEDGELFPVSGIANIVDSLPTFDSSKHTGRMIYDSSTNMFYFGTDTKWQHTTPEYCNEHKDIDLTGTTLVNLDFHDDLAMGTINLSGTLTDNVEITFPQKNQVYVVTNNITGKYTVTLKVNGSSQDGVIADQDLSVLILNDSTQIILVAKDYFNRETTEYTREFLKKESASNVRGYLNLGTAATHNVGTEIGNIITLVNDGYGEPTISPNLIKYVHELIVKPEITSPIDGAGGLDPNSLEITGSAYACLYSSYTRDYRQFQFKVEGTDWSAAVIDHTEDVDTKIFTTLDPDTNYIVRIRDVNINGSESYWSDSVTLNTSSVYVETPDLTIETLNSYAVLSPELTGSAFSVVGTSSSHDYTDWQIVKVSDDATIWESLNDTTNLTSIQVDTQLDPNTSYEFKIRYTDDAGNTSAWKTVSMFTIEVVVDEPTLTVETDSSSNLVFRQDPLLETSDFSVTPDSYLDIHHNTDWRIKKDSTGVIVWSSLDDAENKTSIRIDTGILETDTAYIFEARHRGQDYGVSSWASQIVTTESSFDQVLPPESTEDTFPQEPTLESYGGSGWVNSVEDGYYIEQVDTEPLTVYYNGFELTYNSDVTILSTEEWGFGNADGLSKDVLYIRLAADANPNSQALNDIQVKPSYAVEENNIGGSSFTNSTSPGFYLDVSTNEPVSVYHNDSQLVKNSDVSNLSTGEWGYDDVDSIGESRIYVRLSGDIDPSTLSAEELYYTIEKYWDHLYIKGPQFALLGYPYNHYGTKLEVFNLSDTLIYNRENIDEFDPSIFSSSDQVPAQDDTSTLVDASDNVANAYKLFDKNEVQYWQMSGTSGWAQYEFDTDRRPYLISYSLTIRDTVAAPTQAPKDFKLQGSVSGTDWLDLDVQTGIDTWTGGETKSFTISPVSGTGYRYYRLMINDNNGYSNTELSQIYLYTHTEYNYNETLSVDDLSNFSPNTTYKARIGYNINEVGFTDYNFGSFIAVTTGNALNKLVDAPTNIYPEDSEIDVALSPELESSNFSSAEIDTLDSREYKVIKSSDSSVVYNAVI